MANFPFTWLDIGLLVAGILVLIGVSLLCRRLLRLLDHPGALEDAGETVRRLESAPSLARPPARRPSTPPQRRPEPERRSAAGGS